MSRIIVPVLAFASVLGLSFAVSHAGDLQAQAAKQKAALEKLSGQVRDAVADSHKMSPANAKILLQVMLRQVKDTDMLDRDRAAMLGLLNARLKQVDEGDRGVKVGQDQKPLSDPPKKFKIPVADPPSGGTSGSAKDFIGGIKGAQKNAADQIRDREKGMLASGRDIERVLPMDKEINFPKNWKEITARRNEMVNQKLTANEVKLLKTLNSTMSVNYNPEKFKSVIEHLQDRTGLSIIINEATLRDLNIDYDDPVTFKVEKATVRTILKKILGDKGLTYIIKEGNIQVMTPKQASEYTVIRSYPISDLITPTQMNMAMPPYMQMLQKRQNAQQIINLIVFMTGPDYWQPNGPGSIAYVDVGDTLLIRASAEMHYQLASPGLFGR